MSKKVLLLALFMLGAGTDALLASSYLFYLEAQAVAGWSSAAKKAVFFSMSREEVMQKPSLGFDYVQRFSGAAGDIAVLAVQGRLAVNSEGDKTVEPQLYNAFLKFKTRAGDIWIGHNRPKFGLSSYFDSHAQLLQPLAMNGFGFDRDWGVGVERDTAWGNAGLSLTTGSGMPLHFNGNFFLAARVSKGVLNRENYNIGFSAGYGKLLDVMGYHLVSEEPMESALAALDAAWLWNNVENRIELIAGKKGGQSTYALFWRSGLNLLEEGRLKLEVQPVVFRTMGMTQVQFSAGATYLAHPDWTLRAMYMYDKETKDSRMIFQVYTYKGIRF
ncbi:MAG: hypothetical protein Q8O91_09455 [Candidatus Aminicenantes bacterium]|nr:hypothetical protein [Candidatus Aminicenantes bacterium]